MRKQLVALWERGRERAVPGLFVLILALAGALYWQARVGERRYKELDSKMGQQVELLSSTTASLARSINIINEELAVARSENSAVAERLAAEQAKVASFQSQIQTIGSTVGTLDKLSKTDPELLAKYSKVYFLNEHYAPSNLASIPPKYLYNEEEPAQIEGHVLPNLTRLIDDAASAGVTIYVKSAYRSFFDQASLKGAYTVLYGAGTANQFSADQGYSEHQLGTTVDFITTGLNGQLAGFDNSTAYKWLLDNAYKYGFILSYPEGNKHYVYEPWHWRYVGKALALRLRNDGKNFYDADQRFLDSYLVNIFD